MGYYDIAQICVRGHVVNDSYTRFPQGNREHCERCGARTITKCETCRQDIRGEYHVEGFFGLSDMKAPPSFCPRCGSPYPWNKWWHSWAFWRREPTTAEATPDAEYLTERWKKKVLTKPIWAGLFVVGLAVIWLLNWVGFDNVRDMAVAKKETATAQHDPAQAQAAPDEDFGLLFVPVLPDAFSFPFVVEVTTTSRILPYISAKCAFNEASGPNGFRSENNDTSAADRLGPFHPGQKLHVKCALPMAPKGQTLTSAVITVDVEFSLADRPGRYSATRTFRLFRDRTALPAWELIKASTAPLPSKS